MEIVNNEQTPPVEQEQPSNLHTLSDADFMKHMQEQPVVTTSSDEVTQTSTAIEDTQVTTTTVSTESETNTDESATVPVTSTVVTNGEQSQESNATVIPPVETTTEVPATETAPIDYKAFYESVTQEYKANGQVHPGVKDPEKFIKALQMATDYANKTAALKPVIRKAKLLEGLSDEDLTEMLEFKKGNPEVIKKALKQHNIDPMLVDLDNINYQPHSVVPTSEQVEFQNVIDTLAKDVPLFNKLDDVVMNQLDEKSKQQLMSGNGAYLEALATEMKIGKTDTTPSRFDIIMPMVQQNKLFNPEKYLGMTDLDIYILLAEQYETSKKATVTPPVSVTPTTPVNPVKVVDPDIEAKRVAASITTTITNKAKPTYDPTKLSDEEFMKLLSDGALFKTN